MIRVSSNTTAEIDELEILAEQLLQQQPQSEKLLKRLRARSRRSFAPIHDGRCPDCNVKIATARLQLAKTGVFINCAHCRVFLYDRRDVL